MPVAPDGVAGAGARPLGPEELPHSVVACVEGADVVVVVDDDADLIAPDPGVAVDVVVVDDEAGAVAGDALGVDGDRGTGVVVERGCS